MTPERQITIHPKPMSFSEIAQTEDEMFDIPSHIQALLGIIPIIPPGFTVEGVERSVINMYRSTSNPNALIVSPKTMHEIRKASAEGKRYHQAQLRKKRQRRAAQRKHNRGRKV